MKIFSLWWWLLLVACCYWPNVTSVPGMQFHLPTERYTVTLCLYVYDEDTAQRRIVTKLPEDKVRKKVARSQKSHLHLICPKSEPPSLIKMRAQTDAFLCALHGWASRLIHPGDFLRRHETDHSCNNSQVRRRCQSGPSRSHNSGSRQAVLATVPIIFI